MVSATAPFGRVWTVAPIGGGTDLVALRPAA